MTTMNEELTTLNKSLEQLLLNPLGFSQEEKESIIERAIAMQLAYICDPDIREVIRTHVLMKAIGTFYNFNPETRSLGEHVESFNYQTLAIDEFPIVTDEGFKKYPSQK